MRGEQESEDRGDVRREGFRRGEEFWQRVVVSQSPHEVLRDPIAGTATKKTITKGPTLCTAWVEV